MIVVVDYGLGNLRSVEKALTKLDIAFKTSREKKDLKNATHIILPGVGFFQKGMKNLSKYDLVNPLKKEVLDNKKPLLGICLGMQLLFKTSKEGGLTEGLGFIDGDVKKFEFRQRKKLKTPHVGWNDVFGENMRQIDIFDGIVENSNFYFVHTYHPVLNSKTEHTLTNYGYNFVSAVKKANIYGVQFHPEKSQKMGLRLLSNFNSLKVKNC